MRCCFIGWAIFTNFLMTRLSGRSARHHPDPARPASRSRCAHVRSAGAAAESYLERLIRQGHRVAVCEQMEDPAEAKKRGAKAVVRRDVVRLVTPGTLSEEALLDARANNFLAALAPVGDDLAFAWLDMSTGVFAVCHSDNEGLGALLARLSPSEILLPSNFDADFGAEYTVLETEILSSERAAHVLSDYFNVANPSLLGDLSRAHIAACGTLLAYLQQTQIAQCRALPVRLLKRRSIIWGWMRQRGQTLN